MAECELTVIEERPNGSEGNTAVLDNAEVSSAEETRLREGFTLHKAVFEGELELVKELVSGRPQELNKNDCHGNTALHLAVMLGRKDIVDVLLGADARVKEKNASGWTPLDEAISYGDRPTISSLLKKLREQFASELISRRADLISNLEALEDFSAELKWEFHTWVPFLSRLLPNDVCKIHKTGASIRVDSTLQDFTEMRWSRGDLSFIFNGENRTAKALDITVLNNQTKEFQKARLIGGEDLDTDLNEQVDMLMSKPIVYANMSTKPIEVTRAQSGFFFKSDKTEQVGDYSTTVYNISQLILISRKRTENLSVDDIQKHEEMKKMFEEGNFSKVDSDMDIPERPSLIPPPPSKVTWEEYISASEGDPPRIGRQMALKVDRKYFKATISVADECPVKLSKLLDILEVIVPYKHFHKLRTFVNSKLPPGFPVKLSIPIFPTVTAIVTLQMYEAKTSPVNLFLVPRDYKKFVPKREETPSTQQQ